MLIQKDYASLILVDVQEKLISKIHESEKIVANCRWLLELAQDLEIPTVVSEQYPQGLGKTLPALQTAAKASPVVNKVEFSCMANELCRNAIESTDQQQFILIGIETHVCVMQTAVELLEEDYDVYVVADAVSARSAHDHQLALDRMRNIGAQIVSKEMVFFECLRQAGSDLFKSMSKKYLQ